MRLQKEEKTAMVLLLMALGSLAVAAWAMGGYDQKSSSAQGGTKGASVSVEGIVLEMIPTKSGGNLIIRLDSTPTAIFVSHDSGEADIKDRVHTGDRIRVKGDVSEFNGMNEINVRRAGDIIVLD